MDLQEEYWGRLKVKAPMVKHVEKANLILRAKGKSEWAWLHVNVLAVSDGAHPIKYNFIVSANPQLFASPDMNHFANQSQVVKELVWEWEQYEPGLVDWAKEHAQAYQAISSQDAIVVAWEIFITNYDSWIAHFMPFRMQDVVYQTVADETTAENRLTAIKEVEEFLREKYDRIFVCWKNIKSTIEQRNYADWYAKIINDMAAPAA